MKLAVTISVWADTIDLLPHAINNWLPVVDGVIVIWSNQSNYFQHRDDCYLFTIGDHDKKVKFFQYEPNGKFDVHSNETLKRNYGIDKARELGFTHVIVSDADEFYFQHEVEQCKNIFMLDPTVKGLVCPLKVYIKTPHLVCDDHTLVPFITQIERDTKVGNFKSFPFAYDDQGNAHIDPTRRFNYSKGIQFIDDVFMHHYSHVRKDMNLKIENSSARNNLKKSSILEDMKRASPGVYNTFYRQNLRYSENHFNLPVYE